jgi:hypothetical protein
MEREGSQVLQKMLKVLSDEGVSRSQIAAELRIGRNDLEAMMFGLVMTGVDGGRNPRTTPVGPGGELKLV